MALDYDILTTDADTYYAMIFDAGSGTDLVSTTLYATADEADSAACDLNVEMDRVWRDASAASSAGAARPGPCATVGA